MRDIKFRCLNKATGKMIDLYKTTPVALDANLNCDGLFIPFKEGYEIMQFTGLTDKNGKEIYEGDIILWSTETGGIWDNPTKSIVKFEKGCFVATLALREMAFIEVIGNIHDNPELLLSK